MKVIAGAIVILAGAIVYAAYTLSDPHPKDLGGFVAGVLVFVGLVLMILPNSEE